MRQPRREPLWRSIRRWDLRGNPAQEKRYRTAGTPCPQASTAPAASPIPHGVHPWPRGAHCIRQHLGPARRPPGRALPRVNGERETEEEGEGQRRGPGAAASRTSVLPSGLSFCSSLGKRDPLGSCRSLSKNQYGVMMGGPGAMQRQPQECRAYPLLPRTVQGTGLPPSRVLLSWGGLDPGD